MDDAGPSLPVGNRPSGASHAVASCVAGLGASNSPSAEATWSQSLPDGIGSQVRTLAARGGVPAGVGPANRKAAGTRAHRSEPRRHRPSAALAHP